METKIIEYLRSHPNKNAEDVISEFAGYDNASERREVSQAIANLLKENRIRWNLDNGVITVWGVG